jgi:hypothetical protein
VDQGTQEKVEPFVPKNPNLAYENLRNVLIANENNLLSLSNDFNDRPIGHLKASAFFGFLSFEAKCNRLMFEWIKATLDEKEKRTDAKEDKLQKAFENIDKFMGEYGTFLAKWKNEDQTILSKVKKIE